MVQKASEKSWVQTPVEPSDDWTILSVSPAVKAHIFRIRPGRVAQSVGHLTRKSEALDSIPGLATYSRFVVRYWRKFGHEVLVNRLGDLSLPRKSVVRKTVCPDMTLDVYRGRKTTTQ